MKSNRPSEGFVASAFLAILFGVPLLHAAAVWKAGEAHPLAPLFSRIPTEENLRAFEKNLQRDDTASAAVRPWARAMEFAAMRAAGNKLLAGPGGWLFYAPGVEAATRRPPPGESGPAEAAEAAAAFRDELAARGIRLLVVPVPNKESVHPEHLCRFAAGRSHPDADMDRFFAECDRRGVAALDLLAPFRNLAKDAPLYLERDTHWTPAGMEEATRLVANAILARGWLSPRKPHGSIRRIRVAIGGDLAAMIESPPLEAALPSQVVFAGQIDFGAGAGGAPEIIVLGDSFLRIYETGPPGRAGFSSHLGFLLGCPVATVARDGGGSTIARQTLARKPDLLHSAKVVVWEFVERDLRLGTEGWRRVPLSPPQTR